MGGGFSIAVIGFIMRRRRVRPMIFADIQVIQYGDIDRSLVLGSSVFAVGWGISGICPDWVFVSILLEPAVITPYLVAVVIGTIAYERFHR